LRDRRFLQDPPLCGPDTRRCNIGAGRDPDDDGDLLVQPTPELDDQADHARNLFEAAERVEEREEVQSVNPAEGERNIRENNAKHLDRRLNGLGVIDRSRDLAAQVSMKAVGRKRKHAHPKRRFILAPLRRLFSPVRLPWKQAGLTRWTRTRR